MTTKGFFSRPAERRLRELSADLADQRQGLICRVFDVAIILAITLALMANT
jgi:hypothetical protein